MTQLTQRIFVTVGTTKFDELIETVLSSEVLEVKDYENFSFKHEIIKTFSSKSITQFSVIF